MTKLIAAEAYRCEHCKEYFGLQMVDEEEVAYECDMCGDFLRSETNNENHQCPSCAKFGRKRFDGPPCPGCGDDMVQGTTVEIVCTSCHSAFAMSGFNLLEKPDCPECEDAEVRKKQKAEEEITPVEGPFSVIDYGKPGKGRVDVVTHEDDMPRFDHPVDLLLNDMLPPYVIIGGLIYECKSTGTTHKNAYHVFVDGENLKVLYSFPYHLRDRHGDSFYPTQRPTPYRDAPRHLQDFTLVWNADGLSIVPYSGSWGDGTIWSCQDEILVTDAKSKTA